MNIYQGELFGSSKISSPVKGKPEKKREYFLQSRRNFPYASKTTVTQILQSTSGI